MDVSTLYKEITMNEMDESQQLICSDVMNTYLCSSLSFPNLAITARYRQYRSKVPSP